MKLAFLLTFICGLFLLAAIGFLYAVVVVGAQYEGIGEYDGEWEGR